MILEIVFDIENQIKYRVAIMKETSVIIGTRYAMNIGYKGDHICLEYLSYWGPDMPGRFQNFKMRIP